MTTPTPDVRDARRKGRAPKTRKASRLDGVALNAARAAVLRCLYQTERRRLVLADAARAFAPADVDGEQAMTAHLLETLLDQAIRRVEASPVTATRAAA